MSYWKVTIYDISAFEGQPLWIVMEIFFVIYDDATCFLLPQQFTDDSSFTENKISKNSPLSSFATVLCFIIRAEIRLALKQSPWGTTLSTRLSLPTLPFWIRERYILTLVPTLYNANCLADTVLWAHNTNQQCHTIMNYWQTLCSLGCLVRHTNCLQALWLSITPEYFMLKDQLNCVHTTKYPSHQALMYPSINTNVRVIT